MFLAKTFFLKTNYYIKIETVKHISVDGSLQTLLRLEEVPSSNAYYNYFYDYVVRKNLLIAIYQQRTAVDLT